MHSHIFGTGTKNWEFQTCYTAARCRMRTGERSVRLGVGPLVSFQFQPGILRIQASLVRHRKECLILHGRYLPYGPRLESLLSRFPL
jgi:hypothetical protein